GRALPMLSASASTTGETALVSLSNLDLDQERTLVLDLRGRAVAGHSAQVLTAEAAGTYNTPEQPDASHPARSRRCASTSAAWRSPCRRTPSRPWSCSWGSDARRRPLTTRSQPEG